MNIRSGAYILLITFYCLCAGCNSMICGTAEEPGNLSNPKLAELVNAAIDQNITSSSYPEAPGMLPSSGAQSRQWLKEIAVASLHCNCNPENEGKENRRLIDITLVNGTVLKDIYTSERCFIPWESRLL